MNRKVFILFSIALFSLFYTGPVQAQKKWKKALPTRHAVATNNGKFNIGVKAGAIWSYFRYSEFENTTIDGVLYPIAGLLIEYKTNNRFSIGLNPYVAIRGTKMHHDKIWLTGLGENQTDTTRTRYTCLMNVVGARIPFTYYFNSFLFSGSNSKQFYISVAPEAYYVLGGNIQYAKFRMPQETLIPGSYTSIKIGNANMQRLQLGVTCGSGLSSTHSTSSFSFITKYELAFSFGINNTFSKTETEGSFPQGGGFLGSPYAFLQTGNRSYRALEFTITVMFPVKKQLRGACVNWGEYN